MGSKGRPIFPTKKSTLESALRPVSVPSARPKAEPVQPQETEKKKRMIDLPANAPAWMQVAHYYADKKVREKRGGEHPDIIRFFQEIKHPEFDEDEVPWCAAFIGACLYESNYGHNGSAWAAHYGIWDGADEVDEPQYGDIVVMTRNGGGHVAFFVKDNVNGTIRVLGGNQNDEVNYSNFSKSVVTRYMRPNGKGKPKIRPDEAAGTIGLPSLPGYKAPGPVEIAVGAGGVAAAFTAQDALTAAVFVAIALILIYVVWRKRQS